MSSFYVFVYYQPLRELRIQTRPMESQVHKVRDALMSGGLFPLLGECGYQYRGTILNLPYAAAAELHRQGSLRKTNPKFDESDLILLTTRPPLDDHGAAELRNKRRIVPSGEPLEADLFRSLRPFFAKCDRETIRLGEAVRLTTANSYLREVHFHQSKGGAVRYYSVGGKRLAPEVRNLALGYLVSVPAVRPGMPRFLVVFGAGGMETLLFGYLLREKGEVRARLGDILAGSERRIIVTSFHVPRQVPYPYLHYDPHELNARIIVDETLMRLPASGG